MLIVLVSRGFLLGQLDLPGEATDVAVNPVLRTAVVLLDSSGKQSPSI
jgi:hypothetical protein